MPSLSLLVALLAAGVTSPELVARAHGLLENLRAGDYAAFEAAGSPAMQAAFDAKKAQAAWVPVALALGPWEARISEEVETKGELIAVHVTDRYAHGELTVRLVFDAQARLTGFWIEGSKASARPAPDPMSTATFTEVAVVVDAGGHPLPGLLTLPRHGGDALPGVVLVHGSGPHDADESIGGVRVFRDLAHGLAADGVVVLRYAKRTFVHPTAMAAADWTMEAEIIDDAVAALKLLRAQARVDPRRSFVVGHSLGAWAAPLIVARDPSVAGAVLLAGNARRLGDVVLDQLRYLSAADDGRIGVLEHIQLSRARDGLADMRAGRSADDLAGLPAAYLARLEAVDPVAVAARSTVPLLILQGGRDYQVTTTDFDLWKGRLAGRAGVTTHLLPRLNHLFVAGDQPSVPAEYAVASRVDPEVVRLIARWIHRP